MIKIGWCTNQLDVRGTCTALYDYATKAREIYNIDGVIITPELYIQKNYDPIALRKFAIKFPICYYRDPTDIDDILSRESCDILYVIKYGKEDDGLYSMKVFTAIHCVFDMSCPHGHVYAGVSKTLANKFGKNTYVPHMISLQPNGDTRNLREELKIPKDSVVFGRHGGMDTFNLHMAFQVISSIVKQNGNVYFLFVNTPVFFSHPHIIHLNKFIDDNMKRRFINTCDAFLEAGTLGHSFGLSIGEFSVHQKPIIVYKSPTLWNTSHLEILGDKGLYFSTPEELYSILTTFNPRDYKFRDMNCYREYEPEGVMRQFYDVFIRKYMETVNTKSFS